MLDKLKKEMPERKMKKKIRIEKKNQGGSTIIRASLRINRWLKLGKLMGLICPGSMEEVVSGKGGGREGNAKKSLSEQNGRRAK